ncbi:MAG: tetratricopeptide repeat protein [Pseudomonadota bacterium]|nr:tetratricopeptide repeat protein [Pseudomonadota bacterium]
MTATRPHSRPISGSVLAAILCLTPVLAACDSAPSDPFAAAQAAMEEGSPRTAMEHINSALADRPDDAQVQMLAGDIAMALGNADRAVTEFKAVATGPQSTSLAKAKLAEAEVLANYMGAAEQTVAGLTYDFAMAYTATIAFALANDDVDTASDMLAEGLDKFPEDPRLITIDAERLFTLSNPSQAAQRLAPALKISPPVPQAHRLAGQMALSRRDVEAALDHFNTVLKARPNDQTTMLAMAAIARDQGNEEEAANWINKANTAGPVHPIGLLFAAQMAFDAGDLDRAFELIEKVPPQMATEPSFARLRGLIDASRGQYGAAILPLKGYIEQAGDDYLARRVLATSYAEEGELDNAWRVIAPALDDPQADAATLAFALQLSERLGKGDPAAIRAQIASRQSAPDIDEQMRAASKAIRAGDWAKADSIYAPLLDGVAKDNPIVLNNAAAMKAKLGRHSEAVSLARRALAKAPKSPQILDTLGWALWQEGKNPDEARQLLTKAREAAPTNAEIAEHWQIAHR